MHNGYVGLVRLLGIFLDLKCKCFARTATHVGTSLAFVILLNSFVAKVGGFFYRFCLYVFSTHFHGLIAREVYESCNVVVRDVDVIACDMAVSLIVHYYAPLLSSSLGQESRLGGKILANVTRARVQSREPHEDGIFQRHMYSRNPC